MAIVQNLMERLRPLVGLKGWDYCILWKLSHDQRFLDWIDCCCAGIDNTQNGDEELHFPVSPVLPCRDVLFQHPRTKFCQLLSLPPSSIPLDSGIYAQTLISNQPLWLNFSNSSDLDVIEESPVWTRVLLPVMGGLIELFVTKEVPEDPSIIDFITAQCSVSVEQESMITNTTSINNMDVSSSSVNNVQANNNFPSQELENMNVPYDISVDRIHICNSPMNFLQQFGCSTTTPSGSTKRPRNDHNVFFEESQLQDSNVIQKMDAVTNNNNSSTANMHDQKDLIKPEKNGRSDSVSDCSDQIDDDDDVVKYRRRTGKGSQAKNLHAERKRRKKLNDRMYALRALVPIITKLDRATIIVDAIAYVKQLQKQAQELQEELEENSDDDEGKKNGNMGNNGNNQNNVKSESLTQNGMVKTELDKSSDVFRMGNGSFQKQDQASGNTNEKGQQMEPQVEVAQLDGNELFVKVFCEHKPGGFVKLMEALNSLGLEVTNANVTTFRGLVSNVFKVEKRDTEMVQADHVRDSLLEVTRNPAIGWPANMAKASESVNSGMEYHHQQQHHLHTHHMNSHHHHYLHHLHN